MKHEFNDSKGRRVLAAHALRLFRAQEAIPGQLNTDQMLWLFDLLLSLWEKGKLRRQFPSKEDARRFIFHVYQMRRFSLEVLKRRDSRSAKAEELDSLLFAQCRLIRPKTNKTRGVPHSSPQAMSRQMNRALMKRDAGFFEKLARELKKRPVREPAPDSDKVLMVARKHWIEDGILPDGSPFPPLIELDDPSRCMVLAKLGAKNARHARAVRDTLKRDGLPFNPPSRGRSQHRGTRLTGSAEYRCLFAS